MNAFDRELGMDRDITRRDFLNGSAVALTSALVAPPWLGAYGLDVQQNPEQAADYYPPLRTGMRGSHPGFVRSRPSAARPAVVGAVGRRHRRALRPGRSSAAGSAACRPRISSAPPSVRSARVLDARQPRRLRRARQAQRISARGPHADAERRHAEHRGAAAVQPAGDGAAADASGSTSIGSRTRSRRSPRLRRPGLRNAVWFNKERFGTDRLVVGTPGGFGGGTGNWPEFLAQDAAAPSRRRRTSRGSSARISPTTWPGLTRTRRSRSCCTSATRTFCCTSRRCTRTSPGSTRRAATGCS